MIVVAAFALASIVFAIIAMDSGITLHYDLFHLVFLISILSVAIQGTFLPLAAKMTNKELYILKKDLKGGYTYGLNYFIKLKAKPNKDYMSDGIDSNGTPTRISNSNDAESVYFYNVVPKSTIRGPRLISTSYSAKEQGLKAKNRIVEINDKHIKKYTPEELWTLLNPTQAGQTIKIGYKEKSGGKVKTVTLKSQYQKPILENL